MYYNCDSMILNLFELILCFRKHSFNIGWVEWDESSEVYIFNEFECKVDVYNYGILIFERG